MAFAVAAWTRSRRDPAVPYARSCIRLAVYAFALAALLATVGAVADGWLIDGRRGAVLAIGVAACLAFGIALLFVGLRRLGLALPRWAGRKTRRRLESRDLARILDFLADWIVPVPWSWPLVVVFAVVATEAVATCAALIIGVPDFEQQAGSREFFGIMAQINGTLLVAAGLTIAAPREWRKNRRRHRAWVTCAPLMAVVGLGASLARAKGAIQRDRILPWLASGVEVDGVLFVLAIGAVFPIVFSLLLGAFDRLRVSIGDGLDSTARDTFTRAYLRAGGAVLGEPDGDVAITREGAFQAFRGGSAGQAGIVMTWDRPPVVLEGEAWGTFCASTDERPPASRVADALS